MKSGVRILGAQLAELILGQTLTVPEMHAIVGRNTLATIHPAYGWR